MTNRIIKSLDCCEIILIFCILQVDFAISIITLFVIFNEAFHKALVDKSVCVINIVHLIVLSAIKNPLFDAYFNRVTAYSEIFVCYEGIFAPLCTLCIEVSACYESISDFLCNPGIDIYIFRVRINISDNALFGFRSYLLFLFPFYKTKKIK